MNMIIKAIVGIVVLVIIIQALGWLFNSERTLSKFSSASVQTIIPSNIKPTINYAYGIWFYIDDWSINYGKEKTIFSRADSPKVSLDGFKNNIKVSVLINKDNSKTAYECGIENVPIQKWTHLLVSLNGTTLDIYKDGLLERTCVMNGVPVLSNTSETVLTPNGGFSGVTSKFKYWPDSINPQQARQIYEQGPGGNIFGNLFGEYTFNFNFMKKGQATPMASLSLG